MKALVPGATGFVGAAVAATLRMKAPVTAAAGCVGTAVARVA